MVDSDDIQFWLNKVLKCDLDICVKYGSLILKANFVTNIILRMYFNFNF